MNGQARPRNGCLFVCVSTNVCSLYLSTLPHDLWHNNKQKKKESKKRGVFLSAAKRKEKKN